MADANISKLAQEAELGQGCTLKMQLESQNFEENFRTLKQIELLDAGDRKEDKSLHPVYLYHNGDNCTTYLELYRAPSGSKIPYGDMIFEDQVDFCPDGAKISARTLTCTDIDSK